MSILAFVFVVCFALVLLFVVVSAARRGASARGKGGVSAAWFSDGGASFSDSGSGADCGSSDGGGGSCDGGGGSH